MPCSKVGYSSAWVQTWDRKGCSQIEELEEAMRSHVNIYREPKSSVHSISERSSLVSLVKIRLFHLPGSGW